MNKVKYLSRLTRIQDKKRLPEKATLLSQRTLSDNSIYSSLYRIPAGFLLQFPTIGDFYLSLEGQLITILATPNVSERDLELTCSEEVLPFLLSLQKKLVLHANAIKIKNDAIAFLAGSGAGKSTLATSFANNGYQILTDDCLLLERIDKIFNAHPGQPVVQLYPDSHRVLILRDMSKIPPQQNLHKLPVTAENHLEFCNTPVPLRRLYFLGSGAADRITIQALSSQQAIFDMSRQTFLLDPENRELRENQFNQLGCLSQQVKCFYLDFPRQYEWLPRVRKAVLSHLESHQQSECV